MALPRLAASFSPVAGFRSAALPQPPLASFHTQMNTTQATIDSRVSSAMPLTSFAQNHRPSSQRFSSETLIRFGREAIAGKNGVFFTTQYEDGGGLALVSDQIPRSLNTHHGKDVRVVIPAGKYLAGKMLDANGQPKDGWQDTGEAVSVKVPWASLPGYREKIKDTLTFEVYQKYFEHRKTWLYALYSPDKVLQEADTLTEGKSGEFRAIPELKAFYDAYGQGLNSGGVQLALLCDEAMAEVANRLDPTRYAKPATSRLNQHEGAVDFWITNDWMTGNVANAPQAPPEVGKIFIVHNLYDKSLAPTPRSDVPEKPFQWLKLEQPSPWDRVLNWVKRLSKLLLVGFAWEWLARRQFEATQKKAAPTPTVDNPPYDIRQTYHLPNGTYSLLNAGLLGADAVVVNRGFFSTMRDSEILTVRNQDEVRQTVKTIATNRVFDMHHGIEPEYKPEHNPVLDETAPVQVQCFAMEEWSQNTPETNGNLVSTTVLSNKAERYGFRSLAPSAVSQAVGIEAPTLEQRNELKAWKSQNSAALQKALGLPSDPNAVIFCWTNRLDPYQKLIYLVMEQMAVLMDRHPEVQFIVNQNYDGQNPALNQALTRLAQRFPDRVRHIGYDHDFQMLVNAGSHFSLLPSMFEPYGIAQLQASQLGSLPVASDVDGIHYTVSDPAVRNGEPVRVWEHGQTGILIPREDPGWVAKVLDETGSGHPEATFSRHNAAIWQRVKLGMLNGMERAIELKADENAYYTAMYNGMRFINQEHDWKTIGARYEGPIQKALSLASERANPNSAPDINKQKLALIG
ncbi:MAG: glycogen/starch synthase [Candidatus Melainabacteria bacterium]|nr:glycogen/starch synthase [Candidatus Melainabacteria bacterium]